MTVNYNRELGGWQVNGRGYYASEAEARSADQEGVSAPGAHAANNTDDFSVNPSIASAPTMQPPKRDWVTNPPRTIAELEQKQREEGITPLREAAANQEARRAAMTPAERAQFDVDQRQAAFERGNIGGAGGAYNMSGQKTKDAFDATHDANNFTVGDFFKDVGNTALDIAPYVIDPYGRTVKAILDNTLGHGTGDIAQIISSPTGLLTNAGEDIIDDKRGGTGTSQQAQMSSTGPVLGGAPTGEPSQGTQMAEDQQQEAENELDNVANQEGQETDNSRQDLLDAIDNITRDDSLSQEARKQQQQVLNEQSKLLNRLLGYDPNAYAQQFADDALANATALARSSGGGAAGRQQGIFSALEQMPSIQAESQKQAQALENQRLGMAQQAVSSMGQQVFGIRQQDSQLEEFNASLATEIADQFSDIFKTDTQDEQAKLQIYSNLYIEAMRNTRGYDEMDSQEKMAYWENQTRIYGIEQDFKAKMEQIKKAYPDKDPIDVWLDRLDKGAGAVISAKTGGLI